jgi:hypothetical protein
VITSANNAPEQLAEGASGRRRGAIGAPSETWRSTMHQIELSETQTTVLSGACAREDGLVFPVTASIKGGAVGNVLKSLLKRGLIEEISAADPDTVWRHDEEVDAITLRATPLAYSVLGQSEEAVATDTETSAPPVAGNHILYAVPSAAR